MEDKQKLLSAPPPAYTYDAPPPPPGIPPPHPPSYYQQPPQNINQQQTTIVVEQGRPIPSQAFIAPPDYTYLAFIAVVCFFPLGLLALHIAGKARESIRRGDIRSAYSEAISVRILSRLSISIGSLILTVIILAIALPIALQ